MGANLPVILTGWEILAAKLLRIAITLVTASRLGRPVVPFFSYQFLPAFYGLVMGTITRRPAYGTSTVERDL